MEIRYLGHSSFIFKSKSATVITDPFSVDEVGIKFPKNQEADVITVSHEHSDHNVTEAISGSPFVIKGPGEYEIKGISFTGFPSYHDEDKGSVRGKNTVFKIEMDGVNICHLGDLGHILSSDEIEKIDGVDILCIPVGGTYTIGPDIAKKLIADIDPKVVLPMHYGRPDLPEKTFGMLKSLEDFLTEMGVEKSESIPKLVVTKDKMPEEMKIVLLS